MSLRRRLALIAASIVGAVALLALLFFNMNGTLGGTETTPVEQRHERYVWAIGRPADRVLVIFLLLAGLAVWTRRSNAADERLPLEAFLGRLGGIGFAVLVVFAPVGFARWNNWTPGTQVFDPVSADVQQSPAPAPEETYEPPAYTYVPSQPYPQYTYSPYPQQQLVAPGGATARCADGTLSYSAHHQGTCSWHGGVAQFYR